MQKPDGTLVPGDEATIDKLRAMFEEETGKPHPKFVVGEVLEIKGGRWKVAGLFPDKMVLEPLPY